MNWDQVQGKWTQVKGKAHEKWGKLTNDDLDVIDGKREQFVGCLQERYGILKEEAEKQVDEFAKTLDAENAAEKREERREAGRTRAAGQNH